MLKGTLRDRLDEIDVPTLVLFEAGDKLIPNRYLHENMTTADVAERTRERLPNPSVRLVDEAGHRLMLERPAVFRENPQSFLAEESR